MKNTLENVMDAITAKRYAERPWQDWPKVEAFSHCDRDLINKMVWERKRVPRTVKALTSFVKRSGLYSSEMLVHIFPEVNPRIARLAVEIAQVTE